LSISLRDYTPRDEDAAIALWLRTWQAAYPHIDFAVRLPWWRDRWCAELVPVAEIVVAESVVAEADSTHNYVMIGFVTIDPLTFYLDQIVVAPEYWGLGVGEALIAEAKRRSPDGLDLDVNDDNERAIGFYSKQGFQVSGEGVNPISGKPIKRMSWRP